jgi:ABC-type spermidine/putrescine transport system permease subunit I
MTMATAGPSLTSPTALVKITQRSERARRNLAYVLIAPALALVALLIFFPATGSIWRTLFPPSDGGLTFTLRYYTDFFSNPIDRQNLGFTFQVVFITLGILFVVCFPLALYLRFSNSRLANAVQMLALLPLFVPGIVLAYALIRFMVTGGILHRILMALDLGAGYRTPYQKPDGIIIGLVWDNIPFTLLLLTAGLRQVNDSLIEAAKDVGAGWWRIFWQIILPLMQRPVLIVFALNFMGIFGSYTLPYLLGPAAPQMMGVYMQRTLGDYLDTTRAETQAVITFIICAFSGFIYVWSVTRQRVSER